MAFSSDYHGRLVAAVPFGKHDAAWQEFAVAGTGVTPASEAAVNTLNSFVDQIAARPNIGMVVHPDLISAVRDAHPNAAAVENLAGSIGNAAYRGLGSPDLTPVYVRNPAAAGQF
jgi:hypothetical protein